MKNKNKNKKTTAQIICDELIKVIKEENKMPWQQTFLPEAPKNYITGRYYRGIINIFLCQFVCNIIKSQLKIESPRLEFISFAQLVKYNEQHNTNFRISHKGFSTKVMFSKPFLRELYEEERKIHENGGKVPNLRVDDKGNQKVLTWVRQFTTVFPVDIIEDEKGNKLPIKEIVQESETKKEHKNAEIIVDAYCNFSGVTIKNSKNSICFYRENDDSVHMTSSELFTTLEEYYRTLFHELGHSTGIGSRLNRSCFKRYREGVEERSREELVAEMTSLLLATECDFKSEFSVKNSYAYISSWIEYIENNPNEVIIGMSQAQKACDYILLKPQNLSNNNEILPMEVNFY